MGVVEYENKVKKVQTRNGQYSGYFDGVNRNEKPLGFCHYKNHSGYVSSDLLKKHNCIGRECHYFCRYDDSPYFIDRYRRNRAKRDLNGRVKPLKCRHCGAEFKPNSRDNLLSLLKSARKSGWRIHRDYEECKKCVLSSRGKGCADSKR